MEDVIDTGKTAAGSEASGSGLLEVAVVPLADGASSTFSVVTVEGSSLILAFLFFFDRIAKASSSSEEESSCWGAPLLCRLMVVLDRLIVLLWPAL
jgi:hypothetical protein